jgi:aspartate carbamoyltransferase
LGLRFFAILPLLLYFFPVFTVGMDWTMDKTAKRKPAARKSSRAPAPNGAAAPPVLACPCGTCAGSEPLRKTHELWRRALFVMTEADARVFAAVKALELGAGGVDLMAKISGLAPEAIRQAAEEFKPTDTTPVPPPKAEPGPRPADGQARGGLHEYMDWYEYERRLQRPLMMKLPEFQRGERLRHVIFSAQFDRGLLERLGLLTTKMRELGETRQGLRFLSELLRHKRAMLYFTQASTRTFLSFMAACQILGMQCGEIRDPSVSSEAKGESPLDSIRMFSSYFDVIIMRAKYPDFAEACAYLMNDLERQSDSDRFGSRGVPILNGGSGADEHPTQALLDVYTMQHVFSFESKKDSSRRTRFDEMRRKYKDLSRGLDRKVYCFCGDIGRGRTVRSLATLLSLYDDVTMRFVYPPHPKLQMSADLRELLVDKRVPFTEGHSLKEVIGDIDVLYMTRIQREHDKEEQYDPEALAACRLTPELVHEMKEYAAVMHPFPRNGRDPEIPFEIDDDPRAMYFEQSHNGMWVRAALLSYLFNVDSDVYSEHEKVFSRRHDYNEAALA